MRGADDPCPACGKPTLTAVSTGEQACSDPACRYAHGFDDLEWLFLDLLRRQEQERTRWLREHVSEDRFPEWFQAVYGTWIERRPPDEP